MKRGSNVKIWVILLVLGLILSLSVVVAYTKEKNDKRDVDGVLTINFEDGTSQKINVHATNREFAPKVSILPQEINIKGDSPIKDGNFQGFVKCLNTSVNIPLNINESNKIPNECKTAIFTLLLSGQNLALKEISCYIQNKPLNETNNNNTLDNDQNSLNTGSKERNGMNLDLNDQKYINLEKHTTT